MLSCTDICAAISIGEALLTDFSEECLRPSSYLLRLGETLLVEREPSMDEIVDTRSTDTSQFFDCIEIGDEGTLLEPGRLYLGTSVERVALGPQLAGILSTLSCYSRIGLMVNGGSNLVASTFGMGKPSTITFEIVNIGQRAIRVYRGVKFCHLSLFRHVTLASRSYKGIYESDGPPLASDFSRRPAK